MQEVAKSRKDKDEEELAFDASLSPLLRNRRMIQECT